MQKQVQQVFEDDWQKIVGLLPAGWEAQARELGALKFGRKIKTPEQLLRLLLQHFCHNDSMRTTVAKGAAGQLADISDVGLLKRINKSGQWLAWICAHLVQQAPEIAVSEEVLKGRRLLVIDGSVVSEPRAVNATWRLHYALDLRTLGCHEMHLTAAATGETLTLFKVDAGDVVLCDRGFTNRRGINHVLDAGGDMVARINLTALPLFDANEEQLELLPLLRTVVEGQCREWSALMQGSQGQVAVRICAYRKTAEQRQVSERKLKKETSKRGRVKQVQPSTLEMAGYVVVVTTLKDLTSQEISALYRHRWQVELTFKRLKSLLAFGNLKKKDPAGAKAWLQGKLLVACLIERLIALGELFSPEEQETANEQEQVRAAP
jgi:hypothetical protein